jgi:hypothetical protein
MPSVCTVHLVRRSTVDGVPLPLVLLILLACVALPTLSMYAIWRQRRDFDEMIAPPDDLRRADDGGRPSLEDRDGTGGFL